MHSRNLASSLKCVDCLEVKEVVVCVLPYKGRTSLEMYDSMKSRDLRIDAALNKVCTGQREIKTTFQKQCSHSTQL